MNKDVERLRDKKVYVLDMDGTFYLGNQLIPGSLDFIRMLERQQKKPLFLTNNSSQSSAYYQKKVQKMGLQESEVQVYTSGDVLAYYLKKKYPGKKVYLVGTNSLQQTMLEQGIAIGEKNVEIVVVGFDTSLHYEKIKKTCCFIEVIIGDRLYTDIAFGKKYGITTVLVLSGETRKEDLKAGYQPDYVFPSLVDICTVL